LEPDEELMTHIYIGSHLGLGHRPSGASIATWELCYI